MYAKQTQRCVLMQTRKCTQSRLEDVPRADSKYKQSRLVDVRKADLKIYSKNTQRRTQSRLKDVPKADSEMYTKQI